MVNGPAVTGVTLLLPGVTGKPFKVSFNVTFPTVTTVVPDNTVTAGLIMASITLFTITVAVAVSQFAGNTLRPVVTLASHNWYVITYVPDGVFGANVNTPSEFTLNGPVVTGVTLLLVGVTGCPFNVSLVVTFGNITGVAPDVVVTAGSLTASITLFTITVAIAVSQFAGTTLKPVTGFASHNWYVITYVPDGVFAARVNCPFESIVNGPVVTWVTFVLAAVTTTPFNVSLVVATLNNAVGTVPVATVTGALSIASITLLTTTVAVAVSQLAGTTFNPVTTFASHNW